MPSTAAGRSTSSRQGTLLRHFAVERVYSRLVPLETSPSSVEFRVFWTMKTAVADSVAEEGHSINTHNRVYKNGAALSHSEKLTIGIECMKAKAEANNNNSGKVSEGTIRKIREELRDYGRVLSPDEIRNSRNGEVPSGPGSHVLSAVDEAALFALYLLDPSRSLNGYRVALYSLTGTIVDASTIGKWFNNAFPIKGSMRKSCLSLITS